MPDSPANLLTKVPVDGSSGLLIVVNGTGFPGRRSALDAAR